MAGGYMSLLKKCCVFSAVSVMAAASVCSCSDKHNIKKAEKNLQDFVPITEIFEDSKNYYLIVKDIDDQYWKLLAKGAALSGNELEVNIYMSGSSDETEIDQQIALAEKAVASGADGIIIAPDDAVKLSDCVTKIHEAGIPVVLADTIVNCHDYDVCFMTDNMIAGREAAKELLKDMHNNGVSEDETAYAAIMSGAITVPTLNERVAGFCGYWAEHAPEKWKLLDDITKSNAYEDALSNVEDVLDKNKNIKGIFAVNYFTAAGSAAVMQKKKMTDVSLVCFDFSEEISEFMRDPDYTVSTILQKTHDMGYLAVKACDSISNGETPERKYVDTGIVVLDPETRNTPQVQEIIAQY